MRSMKGAYLCLNLRLYFRISFSSTCTTQCHVSDSPGHPSALQTEADPQQICHCCATEAPCCCPAVSSAQQGMHTARGLSATRGSSRLQANLPSSWPRTSCRETSSTALKRIAEHTPQLEGSSPQGVQHTGCSFPLSPLSHSFTGAQDAQGQLWVLLNGSSLLVAPRTFPAVSRGSGQHTAGWHCHGPILSQLPAPPDSDSPESQGPCAQPRVSISPWAWLRQQKSIMLLLPLLLLLLSSPLFNKHYSSKTET